MVIDTTKDLFYLALAIATLGISGFICWALAEVAKLLHQANETVREMRHRISRVEAAILGIRERFDSSIHIFSLLAESARALLSHFMHRDRPMKAKKKSKQETILAEDEEEEEEEEEGIS
jgi:hypothetical protein